MSLATMLQGQSLNALKAHGAPAVLTRVTPGKQDVTSGAPTQSTVDSCDTYALLDSSSPKTLGFKFGDGLVQGGDIQATIPAAHLDFAPLPGDTLTAIGTDYAVVVVQPTFYAAEVVMYSCLVRK